MFHHQRFALQDVSYSYIWQWHHVDVQSQGLYLLVLVILCYALSTIVAARSYDAIINYVDYCWVATPKINRQFHLHLSLKSITNIGLEVWKLTNSHKSWWIFVCMLIYPENGPSEPWCFSKSRLFAITLVPPHQSVWEAKKTHSKALSTIDPKSVQDQRLKISIAWIVGPAETMSVIQWARNFIPMFPSTSGATLQKKGGPLISGGSVDPPPGRPTPYLHKPPCRDSRILRQPWDQSSPCIKVYLDWRDEMEPCRGFMGPQGARCPL
jgi:hypothetical protein